MRWYHALAALICTICLSFVCLAIISNMLVGPATYSNKAYPPRSTPLVFSPNEAALPVHENTAPQAQNAESYDVIKKVPILLYHAIGDFAGPGEGYFVSEETFAAQLDYLISRGFSTIHLEDLWQHWESGKPLPEKPIIITFDDAYRSFYLQALPLLLERGMSATLFVITNHNHLLHMRNMTSGMIRSAYDLGVEIGSHTHNHLDLTTCSPEEVMPQLQISKEYLEELIEAPVHYLAYPNGTHDETVRAKAQAAGYRMAVGTIPGVNALGQDYFQLYRIYVERKDAVDGFIQKIVAFLGDD